MTRGTVYALAAIARVNALSAGMVAENTMRERRGEAPAYTMDSFEKLIVDESATWNQIIELLRDTQDA